MTALPPSADFTGSAVTEGGFKTAIAALHDYLGGMFGTTGTAAAARLALGVLNDTPEVPLSASTTTNIGAAASSNVLITGSAAIFSFGTAAAGTVRHVRFSGSNSLVHSASLVLPSEANISTNAGDTLEAISLGSGNWVVRAYTRANGMAVVSPTVPVTSVNGMTGDVTVSTTPTTAQVLTATAGATADGIGTYALLTRTFPLGPVSLGSTVSGVSIISGYTMSGHFYADSGYTASGSWKAMTVGGYVGAGGGEPGGDPVFLGLRVA